MTLQSVLSETTANLMRSGRPPGATYLGDGRCRFCVWAPVAERVEVKIGPHPPTPSPGAEQLAPGEGGRGGEDRYVPLRREAWGYHEAVVEDVWPGALYVYCLDGDKERPDPASRFQPQGVHGPSQVVDRAFEWHDACWTGVALQDYILYELHVGTFTPEGTFDAAIGQLDYLKTLGITAAEIMPVNQFPGSRNWGYDGVFPFAVQDSYGGPDAFKRLVDACHARGLAVVLDVVYNHFGPEGNYLWDYGPYFTDRYKTLWGSAVNFDGPGNDAVRHFFLENALYWLREFHVDSLRLDAVHAMLDFSAEPFLAELALLVDAERARLNRKVYLFAESDLNNPRLVRPRDLGGYSLDAQWSDDFHHALHALLTGEGEGYYQDFVRDGHASLSLLAKAWREGYVYTGQYSAFRRRRHGVSSRDVPAYRLVVAIQNHDQVGNRMLGERLGDLVPFDALKVAAGALLLSPFIPLLFMGEEYAEPAPFLYFVGHSDPALIQAVREGRREEFSSFSWRGEPPDPESEDTYRRSTLNLGLARQGRHRVLHDFYAELIRLRKAVPALANLSKDSLEVVGFEHHRVLYVRRWLGDDSAWMVFNFGDRPAALTLPVPPGRWRKLLDSSAPQWQENGTGGWHAETMAEVLDSEGGVELTYGPRSIRLFANVPAAEVGTDSA